MWTSSFWKATGERVLRGAVAGVSAVWFAGDVVFDMTDVDSWEQIAVAAIGGAFSALLLSFGGQAVSGNGPSFNNTEVVPGPGE